MKRAVSLNYAPRHGLRKKTRGALAALGLLVGIGLMAAYGHTLLYRAQLLVLQWRCAHYVDSQVTVPVYGHGVVERYILVDPDKAIILPVWRERWLQTLRDNPDMRKYGGPSPGDDMPFRVGRIPDCWRELCAQAHIAVPVIPARPYRITTNARPAQEEGTIFLGKLQGPDGVGRIIAVNAGTAAPTDDDIRFGSCTLAFTVNIIVPAGALHDLSYSRQVIKTNLRRDNLNKLAFPLDTAVTFYPGHVLANDPSAFEADVDFKIIIDTPTVKPEAAFHHGLLAGKLVDGNTLKLSLEVPEPPATSK